MAQLSTPPLPERWTVRQTNAQYAAIVQLRWSIWANGLRRRGGGGELFGRIFTIFVAVVLLILPTVGVGAGAWYFAAHDDMKLLSFLLWGIFAMSQLLNINLGQPGTTFNPTELIRFPLRVRSYVWIRLFFGLLSPANVLVVTTSLAIAIGVIVAVPALWTYALPAMLVFAATNVLFTRMVFAWVDRWMSTRRAREVFTAIIFTISLGFQVTFNPAYTHHLKRHVSSHRLAIAEHLYHRAEPVMRALPPGLTVSSIVFAEQNQRAIAYAEIAACACFGLLFLAVFALRTSTEFHGENLSDVANVVSAKHLGRRSRHAPVPATSAPLGRSTNSFGMSSTVFTVFGKEFLYLRRNTGLFYGLIAPMVMVFLFAGRLAVRTSNEWLFPTALAYALMGIAPLAYNSFGLEGAGTQFYFLAPVRLRDVFLGKNLMSLLLAFVEIAAVLIILTYVASPPPLEMIGVGVSWAVGTTLVNISIGNLRSVSAPKKIDPNRTANKQASPLSALMSLGILLVAAAFAAGVLIVGHIFAVQRVVLPIMVAYAAVGLFVYLANLKSIDRFSMTRREGMFEELCKR